MSKHIDFLSPLENFQYSINLEFDIKDIEKIESYIPTSNALEIMEEIIVSTRPDKTDRARILTGAYGTGKSNLVLTLLAILSGREANFTNITNKIKMINSNVIHESEKKYQNIIEFLQKKERIKLLPVILNSQDGDLRSTVLSGLNRSLKSHALDDLMPTTFYQAAINKIINWRDKYPETYAKFNELSRIGAESTVEKLSKFDLGEYNWFIKTYPKLTSGSEFNPYNGNDITDCIRSVVNAIKEKGYNGIFLVYDEFSKFLEGNADASSQQNIKILQDIAEQCSRSYASQIHILLISHKNIENYVGDLPKKIIDDWMGISKRFKSITIQSNDAELFEIISMVVKKHEDGFIQYKESFSHFFNKLNALFDTVNNSLTNISHYISDLANNIRHSFSSIIEASNNNFIDRCYPLNPFSQLILPKVSELVAQNERTVFTFLASDEMYGVNYFIKNSRSDVFDIIDPDQIYDFFDLQFRSEPVGSPIRKQCQICAAAISKLNAINDSYAKKDEIEVATKILKTLTLIYIIKQFDILPPTIEMLSLIYDAKFDTNDRNSLFYKAIELILSEKLLICLEFRPHVKIRDVIGNNAVELIETEEYKLKNKIDVQNELNKMLISPYIYPVQYNFKFKMTRYFYFSFIEYKRLVGVDNINEFIRGFDDSQKKADGYIFAVIETSDYTIDECIDTFKRLKSKRVIFSLLSDVNSVISNKKPLSHIIYDLVTKCTAINNILDRSKSDKSINESTKDELMYIFDDMHDIIERFIDIHIKNPNCNDIIFCNNGMLLDINSRTQLLEKLTEICESVFDKTPKINNENINKNSISSQMKNTRKNIIERVLENSTAPNLGLKSNQDIIVLRSVYLTTKIINDLMNPIITTHDLDHEFAMLFSNFDNFLKRAMESPINISDLYDRLKNPDNGFGLRNGIIPFYFVAALLTYKSQVVIKRRDREVPLTAEIIEQINDKPYDFTLTIFNYDFIKSDYLSNLESCLQSYIHPEERQLPRHIYIIKAVIRWYVSLSRFQKESKYDYHNNRGLSEFSLRIKKELSNMEINSYDFLFNFLPRIAKDTNYINVANEFISFVNLTNNHIDDYLEYEIIKLKELFKVGNDRTLCEAVYNYYESLNDRTKMQVFSGNTDKFLEVLRMNHNNDRVLIENLIKKLFNMRIQELNDNLASKLYCIINEIINITIGLFDKQVDKGLVSSNDFKVSFSSSNGWHEKYITASKLPPAARTFANDVESLFEEYGDSLSTSQKAQVCLEVMRKFII